VVSLYTVTCRVVVVANNCGVLVKMIGFISIFGYNLSKLHLNTGNTALSLIYTPYNSLLQTHQSSQQFTVPLGRVFTKRFLVTNLSKEEHQLFPLASVIFKITPRRVSHRKQSLYCCAIVAVMYVYWSVI
jgi:hypothetical protein